MTLHQETGTLTSPGDRTIVAIDGGNSKTDVVLLCGDGTIVRRARSGPFVPHIVGATTAVASIAGAIAEVLDGGRADHIAAYLANADLPIEEDRIRDAMVAYDWADSVVVENDTHALLRAGTNRADAVAVVCGAGINCVGVAADGRRVRYPALGRTTGDWGGGFSLAKDVLWSTSRAEDGRGPATTLSAAVAAHFALPTAVAVAEAMHLGDVDRERIHELIPLLLATAAEGDPVALALVLRQADEIVLLASNTLARLGLHGTPTDIVLGGGILASSHPVLLDAVRAGLDREAPHGRVIILDGIPVIGSALLGIEHVWAGSPEPGLDLALDRVRQQFGETHG